MYLIDTNIFLEVLLSQERMDICKKILDSNIGNKYLSDFSLHSIGAILFKILPNKSIQPTAKSAAADFRRYADKEISKCQRSRCFTA